ncbi:hypothetical protein SAMN05444358_105191 [Ruegeria halocynthiae]|uniref:Alpha 1,4-glycosyltransferase conserved region n=1 Tax=Ruegeria halocynthiae TaxID=985054 RepID=A0A1H3BIG1_9RHOB|nr:hypothetical protein [Ruegeria halocynthiae]SDX41501.1 hypothetical protein SAMN05444358_105191 [Ruegeria halocynthiae]
MNENDVTSDIAGKSDSVAPLHRTRTEPATLWIGDRLGPIEQLSLLSLMKHGMKPVLYSYGALSNAPDGVVLRDADEIVPKARIFKNLERDSYAPFSDFFRYELLSKTDHYWLDCDVLALRPFDFETDYFVARHQHIVANGVLSLPKSSPTLSDLRKACDAPTVDLPWLKRFTNTLRAHQNKDGTIPKEKLPYKALGPLALTSLIHKHGEDSWVLPDSSHYAVQPRMILRRARRIRRLTDFSNAYSVHLFSSVQYRKLKSWGMDEIPPESFLGEALQEYGVDLKV